MDIKATEIKNEQGDFYEWCQDLRNGKIDEDTLLARLVAWHKAEGYVKPPENYFSWCKRMDSGK